MQVGLPKYKHNDITSSLHTIGYDGFSAHIRSEEYLWFKQDAHKVNLLAAWESGWVQSTYDVSVGFAFNNNIITVKATGGWGINSGTYLRSTMPGWDGDSREYGWIVLAEEGKGWNTWYGSAAAGGFA